MLKTTREYGATLRRGAYQLTVPNPDFTLTNLSARTKHERPPEGGMTRVSW